MRHEVAPVKWPQGSGECPTPVLNSRMRPGGTSRQRGVKQGVKPKKSPNHPGDSGERKNGRVNNSEPSMRLRHSKSPKRVVVTAIMGQERRRRRLGQGLKDRHIFSRGHRDPGVEKAPTPFAS